MNPWVRRCSRDATLPNLLNRLEVDVPGVELFAQLTEQVRNQGVIEPSAARRAKVPCRAVGHGRDANKASV
jgi:hypothetical protein